MREIPRIIDNGNIGPVNSTLVPRYSGDQPSHCCHASGIWKLQGAVDIKIVGAPFDTGVSYRPGARFGPTHVRVKLHDCFALQPGNRHVTICSSQVADAGDMALNPFNIEEAIATVEQDALELTADGASLLTIGGITPSRCHYAGSLTTRRTTGGAVALRCPPGHLG